MNSTYLMFGKYSAQSIHQISPDRTESVVDIVERFEGQIIGMYATLGQYDVVVLVNLPGNQEAMEVSVALNRATGISFCSCPALSVNRYDALIQNDLREIFTDIPELDGEEEV